MQGSTMSATRKSSDGESYPAGVGRILKELEGGFPSTGMEELVKSLIQAWKTILGSRIHSCQRHSLTSQSLTLSCDLPFHFRGAGENHVVFVGGITDESQHAIEVASKESSARKSINIFFCLTEEAETHLEMQRHLLNPRCVIVGVIETRQIFLSTERRVALRDAILDRVSRESLVPFVTSEPAEGACFFGREQELAKLTTGDQDYALCGVGGMGKSSLLRQMRWTLRSRRDDRFSRLVEVDLLGITDLNAAARHIAARISPTRDAQHVSLANLEQFLRRVKSGDLRFRDGSIDLVLDEMDTVLSVDRRSTIKQLENDSRSRSQSDYVPRTQIDQPRHGTHYPLMQVLRHCRVQGLIRLTISGRVETRTLLEDLQNPFTVDSTRPGGTHSRLKQMTVEPLTTREAETMLLSPLRDLKYLEHDNIEGIRDVLKRLATCQGIPFHIADLGLDLIDEFTTRTFHSAG